MDKELAIKALNKKLTEVSVGALMATLAGNRDEILVHLGYGDALYDMLNILDGAPARKPIELNPITPFTL